MTLVVRKPKRIVTFLGAGASAPFGYPTTKIFLEKLQHNLLYFPNLPDERKYLLSLRNLYRVKDIEHVVEILDTLLEMEDMSRKSRLSNVFFKYKLAVDFGPQKKPTSVLEGKIEWGQLIEMTKKLRDRVEEFTFEQYESNVTQYAKVKRLFGEFFSMLKGHMKDKQTFEVITTNYDNVIEDYCTQSGHTCVLSVLNHEFSPITKRVSEEKYALTKLHGSLNWLIDKQTRVVQVTDIQSRVRRGSSRWDRNEYVLFGTKARLGISGIYDELFSQLERILLETDVCVVVGFSFRDDHINKRFNEALYENKSLKIIILSRSPIGSAQNLIPNRRQLKEFRTKQRIIPIKGSFGTKRVISMTNEALTEL